jgi:hypothetical protein
MYKVLGTTSLLDSTGSDFNKATAVSAEVSVAGVIEVYESDDSTLVGSISLTTGMHTILKDPAQIIKKASSGGAVANMTKIAHL